ncbi:hypothetical protein [Galbibacter sp.]|uniref:hypothetical protein n=1 Tax=Galbibacter sp. TaxID=2918471 RepID=UPI003A9462BE
MKSFDKEILKLFSSLGHFSEDYHNLLDGIKDLRDQSVFINDLYRRITSEQFKRDLAKEGFGIKVVNGKTLYRYSDKDLELAKISAPMATEAILEADGLSLEERIKYRATGKFHERKHEEIKFYAPFVEKDFTSISKRKVTIPKAEDFIDSKGIYSDMTFNLLKFPTKFDKLYLDELLEETGLSECFYEKEHFNLFKENTFELYSEGREKPYILSIPRRCPRATFGKKLYKIYFKFKNQRKDYNRNEIDLRKQPFANAMLFNFADCRESKSNNPSYDSQIHILKGEIRP